ncbi:hypothetical protein [Blautia sp. AF19-10LB]|nr:hypothetical protein [Blautia sp. AF19-10LB]
MSDKPYRQYSTFFDLSKKARPSPVNITVRQSRQSGVARATCPD